MKKLIALAFALIFLSTAVALAWAGGDKVRGEKGLGEVNQVGFNSQDNQG
ncbi:MAG: hypothetical protein JW893_03035 [Candidatus Omnitrophica bacterium]|nr:hypothetical protein [Candidatus Omnitrophota bacterium]